MKTIKAGMLLVATGVLFTLVAAMSSTDNGDPLSRAVEFERTVNAGKLSEAEFTQTMEELLRLPDNAPDAFFVRALLHAAAAQWVGHANNGIIARYSTESLPDAPQWLHFYADATHDEQISYDYIRHLALENKLLNSDSLRTEVSLYIDRARRMGETALAGSLSDIRLKMEKAGENASACRTHWLAARCRMRSSVLQYADAGDTLLLYTRHAYHYKPNVCGAHVTWGYKPGGDLLAVSIHDGLAKPLFKNQLGPGHFHGMDLWFDANRIVFAYATQNSWPPPAQYETVWPIPEQSNACFAHELRSIFEPPHLYELDIDTHTLTRLTNHNYWSDTEPAYLPSGGIVFASDRSAHSPSCDSQNNELTDLNLYTLTPDHQTIRRMLNHKDIDTHPRLLNDGSIAYLRWEYQERWFMDIHSVWSARPDGSNADAIYKQHFSFPHGVRLATPLGPRSQRLLAVATGHHSLPQGPLVILDPTAGGNNPDGIHVVTRGMRLDEGKVPDRAVPEGGRFEAGGFYTDPHALSEKSFLASYAFASPSARRYSFNRADVDANGYGIYLVDVYGNKELLYRDPWLSAYNALDLRPRPTPPILADRTDRTKNYATCTIADVYQGMDSVSRGDIRFIRISEALPWPIVPDEGVKRWTDSNFTWDSPDATRWCPVRVFGTVPVEVDGSAHFKVPIHDNASVYFQALDENYMEIRRMRSSVSFAPGEVRSCTGCHETQTAVVSASSRATARALTRKPSEPTPPTWGADKPIHFPRDVQPILDKHCVACHGGNTPKAGLDFSAEKAFRTIHDKNLVAVSKIDMNGSITQVKQFGSHASKLTQAIRSQEKMKVSLTDAEWQALVTWVDANIPYTGELFHLRTADGRSNVWAPFEWTAPWGQAKEVPAQ